MKCWQLHFVKVSSRAHLTYAISAHYVKSELPDITDEVYLDISIDDLPAGRIVLGLFGKVAPRTVENFKRLCACDAGKGKLSGVDLCYKGSLIHRISKFPQLLLFMAFIKRIILY